MTALPIPEDVDPLTAQEVADAIAWYEANAPVTWDARPPASSDVSPRYTQREFTPAPLAAERIPAVSFITRDAKGDRSTPDLLVLELRTGTVLRLPVGATEPADLVLDVPHRWNYPAHMSFADLDSDGTLDRIVAGLGGMNPMREEKGGVLVEFGGAAPRALGTRLARASDAEAGDLDGDGDLDLAVCAFGWRGEGRLVWWEQVEERWVTHEIDPRDGFIHAIPHDLDGDGDLDLIAALAQEFEEVIAFENDGSGQFSAVILDKAPHPGWGTSGIELADLDRDGDIDILVSHGDTLDVPVVKPYHGVSWLENQGNYRFVRHLIGTLPGCERAVAGDVDGDGDLDVVAVAFLPQVDPLEWQKHSVDSVVLFERSGAEWIRHAIERGNPLHPSVELADLDQNGTIDIAVGNYVWMDDDGKPRHRRDYVTVFYREAD